MVKVTGWPFHILMNSDVDEQKFQLRTSITSHVIHYGCLQLKNFWVMPSSMSLHQTCCWGEWRRPKPPQASLFSLILHADCHSILFRQWSVMLAAGWMVVRKCGIYVMLECCTGPFPSALSLTMSLKDWRVSHTKVGTHFTHWGYAASLFTQL